MSKKSLGILVCDQKRFPPFGDASFYRELCRIGQKVGLTVFVFSAPWVKWNSRTTTGYAYDDHEQSWIKASYPLPQLIYDRSFHRNQKHLIAKKELLRNLKRDRKHKHVFLGIPLKDKWTVYRCLLDDPLLRNHLPKTVILKQFSTFRSMLETYRQIYLKPISGSQGKGVFRITHTAAAITVRGRTTQNKPLQQTFKQPFVCYVWLLQQFSGRTYICQPALQLTSEDGHPYDVRVLMQKNEAGKWELTGSAVRIGPHGSLTSNLHGGGTATFCEPFLTQQFGQRKKDALMIQLKSLSDRVVHTLEDQFGRLAEVGLDFGIERSGSIWLIEANSKPGRLAFTSTRSIHQKATEQPIHFAKYVLDHELPMNQFHNSKK